MNIPTVKQAHLFIDEAEKMNPGPWVNHSHYAAEAARAIASGPLDIDPDAAYVLGLLHDIGRRAGVWQMRHIIDGYNFLADKGFDDAARICITHSFAYKEIDAICGKWDCDEEDRRFVREYLSGIEYNSYDLLIQLCDVLALPSGFCLMEKRLVDVALRYGTTSYTVPKWKSIFKIKDNFERKLGYSIYSLLPGIVENTFGISADKLN